jgi:chromosome partitioning protein
VFSVDCKDMPKAKPKRDSSALSLSVPIVIGFVNQKGGAGKTTGATHASVWFKRQSYSVVLVDADGQQSSSDWIKQINSSMESEDSWIPCVINSDPEELFKLIPELKQQYDIVIVDGPANIGEVTKTILFRSDLALIPSRESFIDLRSTGKILEYVAQAKELRGGLPIAAMYLNAVKANTLVLKDAEGALKNVIVPLLKTMIHDRTCLRDASGQANTVFEMRGTGPKAAAKSFDSLFKEALRIFSNG